MIATKTYLQHSIQSPFGMVMPGRNWAAATASGYGFGFNGQIADDEISEPNKIISAEFWLYSPLIGRRWDTDPIVKESESPYVTFKNNPIIFRDPSGADGEAVIDKQAHTINVTANIYYDKSNPEFEDRRITCDDIDGEMLLNGEIVPRYIESVTSKDDTWNTTVQIEDEDGQIWTVSFNVNLVGLDNQDLVDQKLKEDPLANSLKLDLLEYGGILGGEFDGKSRELILYKKGLDSQTFIHELGHLFGLEHSCYEPNIPENPYFGSCEDIPFFADGYNGTGSMNGPVMSYANNTTIATYEYRLVIQDAINISKSTNLEKVSIHIKGRGAPNPDDSMIENNEK